MAGNIEYEIEQLEKFADLGMTKMPSLRMYVEKMDAGGMKLSWSELHELAMRFASERDDQFFSYILDNYKDVQARAAATRYVPPSALVVSTERAEACVAAVLGIGIGWVWAWLAVSPWTIEKPDAVTSEI